MLPLTYQTLKEEASMHACSSRGLGFTKLRRKFGYMCKMGITKEKIKKF